MSRARPSSYYRAPLETRASEVGQRDDRAARLTRLVMLWTSASGSRRAEGRFEHRRDLGAFEEQPEDVMHDGCMSGMIDLKLLERRRPIFTVVPHAD